jgi:DNA-binding transcriptional ArsR family regulator
VDHDLIAAGHPDLAFELDTFTTAQPAHHRPAASALRVRAWAVGQSVALAEGMRLVRAHAGRSWPEFSDLECYQCHHDLRAESWRIQRGYGTRRPGSLQINGARLEIVRVLAAEGERTCGTFDLGLSKATRSHHFKVLREAGLTHTRAEGTHRHISLRRDDLDARFPGLLDAVLAAAEREAIPAT